MKVLYIGHYMPGCTTRMRGEKLKVILQPEEFFVVDTDVPIYKTNRLFRSIGWRLYKGPLIKKFNDYLKKAIYEKEDFDLIWVDKGVFLEPGILQKLKTKNNTLVHFTPDTAFTYNNSRLFREAIPLYDFCVTTKSFEIDSYKKAGAKEVIFCTQGYDEKIHYPRQSIEVRKGIVFVGLYEPWREKVLQLILDENIPLKLSGVGWDKFVKKNKHQGLLTYFGNAVFDSAYGELVSSAEAGIGLLSKRFPEKHTTRTIEIPACGTALITEDNDEIRDIFNETGAIYFKDIDSLKPVLKKYSEDKEWVTKIAKEGHAIITGNAYDYSSIIRQLLSKMKLLH